MTSLFATAYLDEDVSVVVADILRARGFRAATTRDADQLGSTDERQLEYAATQRMVLVTHNRVDFELLHKQYLALGHEHWGIVIAGRRRPLLLVNRLLQILNKFTAEEIKGQLLYV